MQQARIWISQSLENQGKPVIGPIQQLQVRPWSTILRAPNSVGYTFFKDSIPLLAGEPGLTQMLYRWRPDCAFPVLAAYPIPQTLHHDDFHDGNVFGPVKVLTISFQVGQRVARPTRSFQCVSVCVLWLSRLAYRKRSPIYRKNFPRSNPAA